MLAMQTFRNWLVSPAETPDARKSRLVRLTRLNCLQIRNVASELVWYVWGDPQS